ncbi:MAG TPA: UDP-N-acetylmuramoyl-L-alanine--D-glutamate ligase, partial [Thermoanaerobaculia bacterium]|nr:UDP-N-acetylmuramoyl-L-alanine--D-glutamate ligase [Thermoanaerobaculia bacterium]
MNGPWNSRLGRVLVYGLGLSGRAAARLLLAHGATVLAVDDKAVDAGDLAGKIEVVLALPPDVDLVVVSPGVPLDKPLLKEARAKGVPVIAEVELAYRFLDGPVVAITGSNGKSTTTAMAGAMARAAGLPVEICGNIGEP